MEAISSIVFFASGVISPELISRAAVLATRSETSLIQHCRALAVE
jgi:hypothetical protein